MLVPQAIVLKPSVDEDNNVTLASFDVGQFVIGHTYLFHSFSEGAWQKPKPNYETTDEGTNSEPHGKRLKVEH